MFRRFRVLGLLGFRVSRLWRAFGFRVAGVRRLV